MSTVAESDSTCRRLLAGDRRFFVAVAACDPQVHTEGLNVMSRFAEPTSCAPFARLGLANLADPRTCDDLVSPIGGGVCLAAGVDDAQWRRTLVVPAGRTPGRTSLISQATRS